MDIVDNLYHVCKYKNKYIQSHINNVSHITTIKTNELLQMHIISTNKSLKETVFRSTLKYFMHNNNFAIYNSKFNDIKMIYNFNINKFTINKIIINAYTYNNLSFLKHLLENTHINQEMIDKENMIKNVGLMMTKYPIFNWDKYINDMFIDYKSFTNEPKINKYITRFLIKNNTKITNENYSYYLLKWYLGDCNYNLKSFKKIFNMCKISFITPCKIYDKTDFIKSLTFDELKQLFDTDDATKYLSYELIKYLKEINFPLTKYNIFAKCINGLKYLYEHYDYNYALTKYRYMYIEGEYTFEYLEYLEDISGLDFIKKIMAYNLSMTKYVFEKHNYYYDIDCYDFNNIDVIKYYIETIKYDVKKFIDYDELEMFVNIDMGQEHICNYITYLYDVCDYIKMFFTKEIEKLSTQMNVYENLVKKIVNNNDNDKLKVLFKNNWNHNIEQSIKVFGKYDDESLYLKLIQITNINREDYDKYNQFPSFKMMIELLSIKILKQSDLFIFKYTIDNGILFSYLIDNICLSRKEIINILRFKDNNYLRQMYNFYDNVSLHHNDNYYKYKEKYIHSIIKIIYSEWQCLLTKS